MSTVRISLGYGEQPLYNTSGEVIATLRADHGSSTRILEKSREEWTRLGLDFKRTLSNPRLAFEELDSDMNFMPKRPEEKPDPPKTYSLLPVYDRVENKP